MKLSVEGDIEMIIPEGSSVTYQGPCRVTVKPFQAHPKETPVEYLGLYKVVSELTNEGYEYTKYSEGTEYWFLNGHPHREDGPAIKESNGYEAWYLNGKRHCADGPAVKYKGGTVEYWLEGKKLAKSGYSARLKAIKICEGKKT